VPNPVPAWQAALPELLGNACVLTTQFARPTHATLSLKIDRLDTPGWPSPARTASGIPFASPEGKQEPWAVRPKAEFVSHGTGENRRDASLATE
jgi:hypothetical protein